MELDLNFAHLHLLLNHFPIIGWMVAVGLFLLALVKKSHDLKRASLALFFAMALIALPAYMTGYPAQEAVRELPQVSVTALERHQVSALLALLVMEAAGAIAWFGLWQYRRHAYPKPWVMPALLVLSVAAMGLMARAANIGGEITHGEIRAVDSAAVSLLEPEFLKSASVSEFLTQYNWVWPIAEIVHFIGLSLLFGVVMTVNLRLLGIMKHVPLADVYRLLPWGLWAFIAQAVTGMLFYISQTSQYMNNPAFHWKVILMLAAGANVLLLTLFDDFWELGADDDAPMTAKLVSVTLVFLWVGVIYFGRMLPYIGGAF